MVGVAWAGGRAQVVLAECVGEVECGAESAVCKRVGAEVCGDEGCDGACGCGDRGLSGPAGCHFWGGERRMSKGEGIVWGDDVEATWDGGREWWGVAHGSVRACG